MIAFDPPLVKAAVAVVALALVVFPAYLLFIDWWEDGPRKSG